MGRFMNCALDIQLTVTKETSSGRVLQAGKAEGTKAQRHATAWCSQEAAVAQHDYPGVLTGCVKANGWRSTERHMNNFGIIQ